MIIRKKNWVKSCLRDCLMVKISSVDHQRSSGAYESLCWSHNYADHIISLAQDLIHVNIKISIS